MGSRAAGAGRGSRGGRRPQEPPPAPSPQACPSQPPSGAAPAARPCIIRRLGSTPDREGAGAGVSPQGPQIAAQVRVRLVMRVWWLRVAGLGQMLHQ